MANLHEQGSQKGVNRRKPIELLRFMATIGGLMSQAKSQSLTVFTLRTPAMVVMGAGSTIEVMNEISV
ncbi:MAG: hypothetical protein ACKO23_13205 [Gemmataceae bacterium]